MYRRSSYHNAMLANGCSTFKKYAHKDPFFGIDMFVPLAKAMQSGSMLATVEGLFTTYGKTFQSNSWATTVINTMDPLVTQTVLANSPEKFDVAPSRRPKHREANLLWVKFSVIPSLEKHVNRLLELIPRDGSTIDLQPLLKSMLIPTKTVEKVSPTNYVYLDELVKKTKDKTELLNQMLNLFLPARDSTSSATGFIFFHLARHPDVWMKLREEVVSVGAPITFDLLKSMKYLNLRLLAPAGLSIRTCVEDCVLSRGGGTDGKSPFLVPPGTEIRIVLQALHEDRDIWGEDAMEFGPERWENLRTTRGYIPFLGGGRICPAQQMAPIEVFYLVVRSMQEFKVIENRDPEKKFVAGMKLSMGSENSVKVGFEVA
ncbi:hypothetical protein BGAL_0108g00020 [Botrytis galanthina]|uniref:Cytochrome P450 n=1 Tax=Botrytis galanthina TaxID=278940 RepID=A0A4V6T706_9HELO|nr:hypothetical protein BGAL_0108g00020 [Botrytis galanthina]